VANEQVLGDVLDGKITVFCGKHGYFGEGPPTSGCAECWKAYFILWFRKVPANRRADEIAKMYEIVRHMVEEVEKGKFDATIYPHPQITITKGN
jgi:hypothetical protein